METIELPAYWASAIINGDDSALNDEELEMLVVELDTLEEDGMMIVDVSDDTFFGRYAGLGTEMAEYTVISLPVGPFDGLVRK